MKSALELRSEVQACSGLESLRSNPYPGRGFVVGVAAGGKFMVQIFWTMGRTPNSQNRVFEHAGPRLSTEAADPKKVVDPTNIFYNAMDEKNGIYVVSNGVQTDAIIEAQGEGVPFARIMETFQYENDPPTFTPRITAFSRLRSSVGKPALQMYMLRKSAWDDSCERDSFSFESLPEGIGYCLHTYKTDGNPAPSYEGKPFLAPLKAMGVDDTLESYWNALNEANRVSIAMKYILLSTGESGIKTINKYTKEG